MKTEAWFDLRRCVPMTRDEEYLCATEYTRTKSPLLAARMVAANMRLVVKIAYRYRRPAYDMSDLVQEGNVGLVKGVARFDPTRGVRLSSYAAWWIRAYILKYTLDNWRLVKAGTSEVQRKLFFNLQKQQRALERCGVEANSHNLAEALNVPEKDIVLILERFTGTETSWDAPRQRVDNEGWSLVDTLADAPALQPDTQLETSDFARHLRERLKVIENTLAGRELAIFRRRLFCDEPATLAELAIDFGVSRERTRQIEERLKRRIRLDLTRDLGSALEARRHAPHSVASPARTSIAGSAGAEHDRRPGERIIHLPASLAA